MYITPLGWALLTVIVFNICLALRIVKRMNRENNAAFGIFMRFYIFMLAFATCVMGTGMLLLTISYIRDGNLMMAAGMFAFFTVLAVSYTGILCYAAGFRMRKYVHFCKKYGMLVFIPLLFVLWLSVFTVILFSAEITHTWQKIALVILILLLFWAFRFYVKTVYRYYKEGRFNYAVSFSELDVVRLKKTLNSRDNYSQNPVTVAAGEIGAVLLTEESLDSCEVEFKGGIITVNKGDLELIPKSQWNKLIKEQ